MQIVIDIPENQYSLIMQSHRSGVERFVEKEAMMYAIKNGTPLPKGHGRMIDADALYGQYEYADYDFDKTMEYAPTIIEADRRSEE